MASRDIEIELKFPLENSKEIITFLDENAEQKSKNVVQKDTYFSPAHRDFLKVEFPFEWLRLRESAQGFSLNYKHFHPENAKEPEYCDEFETNVSDVETMRKIFGSLDFKKTVVVEKSRSTWIFEDVEIVIDDVKGLGTFIELEAINHFDEPKEGKEYLRRVLKKLNARVGEEDHRGYPFMILKKQG